MFVKLAKDLNPEANGIYHFLRNCWQKCRHENVILAPLKMQGVCRLVSGIFWGFGCVRFGFSKEKLPACPELGLHIGRRARVLQSKEEIKRGKEYLI